MKKIIDYLVLKNARTQGKVVNTIIGLMCFLGLVLIGIISMIFILG